MSTTQNSEDEQLVELIVAGDTEIFSLLLQKYESYIFAIVGKYVPRSMIEDVAQEVSIQIFQSLARYEKGRSFKAWLSTIAVRRSYDCLRKNYRNSELPVAVLTDRHQDWLEQLSFTESQDKFRSHVNTREARELFEITMAQMTPADQMVIKLLHFEGHSVAETASMLGWSKANVKVRAYRSRKKLFKLIKKLID